MPNLCRNCKHFIPNKEFHRNTPQYIEYGRCGYYQKVNLVSGKIEYDYASVVREYKCNETYFEQKDPSKSFEEIPWWAFWRSHSDANESITPQS